MPSNKVTTAGQSEKETTIHAHKMGAGGIRLKVESYTPPLVEPKDRGTKAGVAPFGVNNRYPQHSIEQYKSSPTHSAICGWMGEMFAGNGFIFEGAPEEWIKALGDDRTINRIGKNIGLDFKIHNGWCVQVRWARDGKTISRIKWVDFSHVRKLIDENGDLVAYLVCKNWQQGTKETSKGVIQLPPFDPERVMRKQTDEFGNVVQDSEGREIVAINPDTGLPYIDEPVQLFWFAGTCPGMVHYPYPVHVAADICIKIDTLFGEFHVNNILNGMLPSFILTFNGPEPEEEEKAEILHEMEKNLKGVNGKRTLVFWTGDESIQVKVDTLDVKNNSSVYLEVHKNAITQIISAHRLPSPTLAGVAGGGNFGGNAQELEAAFKICLVTCILPGQDAIIEGMQHMLDRANMPYRVSISQINPFAVETTTVTNEGGGSTTTEPTTGGQA